MFCIGSQEVARGRYLPENTGHVKVDSPEAGRAKYSPFQGQNQKSKWLGIGTGETGKGKNPVTDTGKKNPKKRESKTGSIRSRQKHKLANNRGNLTLYTEG